MARDALSREEAERRAADVLAELARLRAIEAAARALPGRWWRGLTPMEDGVCLVCGAVAYYAEGVDPYADDAEELIDHAPDCAAMALDAALAEPSA